MKEFIKDKSVRLSGIFLIIIIFIYFLGCAYFKNHFFIGTSIDGINISCKTIEGAKDKIYNNIGNYSLMISGRNGLTDEIDCNQINLRYEGDSKINDIKKKQKPFKWVSALIYNNDFKNVKLFSYDDDILESRINNLNFLNQSDIVEPENPKFQYTDGSYIILKEVQGNKINHEKFINLIKEALEIGKKKIDIENEQCYEKPQYTADSEEVKEAKNIMDKYVSSKVVYLFGENVEVVDGTVISKWIHISEDMKPYIDECAVKEYIKELSKKYDTIGIGRRFESSVGKTVIVKGGYYGWKINRRDEIKELINNIEKGQNIFKEPLYSQKAVSRSENDIGDTYVEVNITRQHVWFYKNGNLLIEGDVVTGCKSKNTPTHLGVYGLNYKQKGATLKGNGYSSDVSYWMPFNGNIGLHDASWRSSFGGNIYVDNGTHGCVNMPKYLAKTIFENIEDGTPIICYSEETKRSSDK